MDRVEENEIFLQVKNDSATHEKSINNIIEVTNI